MGGRSPCQAQQGQRGHDIGGLRFPPAGLAAAGRGGPTQHHPRVRRKGQGTGWVRHLPPSWVQSRPHQDPPPPAVLGSGRGGPHTQPRVLGDGEAPSVKTSLAVSAHVERGRKGAQSASRVAALQCSGGTAPGQRGRERRGLPEANATEQPAAVGKGSGLASGAALLPGPRRAKCCCQAHPRVGTLGPRSALPVERAGKR